MIVVLSDNLENHNIIERKIQVFERTNHIREEMKDSEETCRKKSSGNSISRCCNKAIDRNYAFEH